MVVATIGRVGNRLVTSDPKTARSRRAVPLNPAVVAMLRRHSTTQKQDRLRAGNQWVNTGLVFTNEFGGSVEPRNLLRVIEVAAKAAGAAGIGVHTLRHSAAVAWLKRGYTSRPWPICSGTAPSPSPAACTGTPPRTRPGPPSTGWPDG
jgi:integrase